MIAGRWNCAHLAAAACIACALASFGDAQSVDAVFNPGANDDVRAVALQANGKIVIGGEFTMVGGGATGNTTREHIARLNADGSLDVSFNPGANGTVNALAVQPDGKILVGGSFSGLVGSSGSGWNPRRGIGRLNPDGSLDTTFNPGSEGWVNAIVVRPDGDILVGGNFQRLGYATRYYIGQLSPEGGARGFNPGAGDDVETLALQPDGKVVAGGQFRWFGDGSSPYYGTQRYYIGRANPDGSSDSFAAGDGANNTVLAVALQADGKVVVAGDFTTLGFGGGLVGSAPRNYIGRLNGNGSLDTGFNPGAGGTGGGDVRALLVQPDGKILVGGYFWRLGGGGTGSTARNYIGRINPNGSVDANFDPGANGPINAFAVQPDGKIVVVGNFERIGGGGNGTATRNHIARLLLDGSTTIPQFTTHPLDRTVAAGANASFTVAVSGSPTPTLQWQVSTNSGTTWANLTNTAPYSGVTSTTLTVVNVPTSLNGARFRCVATNSAGSATSTGATLTVNAGTVAPTFSTQPSDQVVADGASARFTVAVSGTPAPTLQWQTTTGSGTTWTNLTSVAPYSGVTATTLTVNGVTMALNGARFRCVATNSAGSATSHVARLTVSGGCALVCFSNVPQAGTAGQSIDFFGGAESANCSGTPTHTWTFGDGQISTEQGPSHAYAANGTYTWTLTVSQDGASCTQTGTVTVTGGTTTTSTSWIPSIAHAPGAGTSKWRSNIGVVNRSGGTARLTLVFVPYAAGSIVTRNHTLPNNATAEWADVLVSLFGFADSANIKGTVKITSDREVVAMARTYNQAASGTFGQYYPALTAAQGITSSQAAVLPLLKKNTAFRANVGFQNLGPGSCSGEVKLFNAAGAQVGSTRTLTASGDKYIQEDDIFTKADASTQDVAYARVQPTTAGCKVWFFGSVVDATTNDPTTIPQQLSQAGPFWIPSIAHAPGAGTSKWRSNIAVVNRSGAPANITLDFVPYAAGAIVTRNHTLANNATVEWSDVLVSLIGFADAAATKGTLKITSDRSLFAMARTNNQAATGTFGQYYPALTASQGISSSQAAVLPLLKKNAAFRANVGFQSLGPDSCSGEVKLFNAAGAQVGSTRTLTASGDKYIQEDDVFTKAGAGTQDVAYARVQLTTAGCSAWFFGSVVDAVTNDPTTIPPQP